MSANAKSKYSWQFVAACPPREVFATMEQMLGTAPYRFEPVGHDEARIVEYERNGFFGNWVKAKRKIQWVHCVATESAVGTQIRMEASSGRAAMMRALQLVQLLTRGADDRRTIYRRRDIPAGPVSLVASYASTPYALFTEPRFDSPRGAAILTATEVEAIPGGTGPFVKVRLANGAEGYVERDQIVPAPSVATRAAQVVTARIG